MAPTRHVRIGGVLIFKMATLSKLCPSGRNSVALELRDSRVSAEVEPRDDEDECNDPTGTFLLILFWSRGHNAKAKLI